MYEQSARPGTCTTNNLKPWHGLESPQFVAFSNLPETGDSFINKVAVIVSTPKPDFDNGKLPNFFQTENTLVASSNNDPLSGIMHVPTEGAPYIWYNGHEEYREEYVAHDDSYTVEKQDRKENCAKVKTLQTATVNPFAFNLQPNHRQKEKQESINKARKMILEEEKKMKVFRANPVPKFLKARSVPTNTNEYNNNDNRTRDRNDKIKSNANKKAQSINIPKKPIKKNTEIWKKPPFMPFLTKKSLVRPKGPYLHTALRAEERKRFENIMQEKETQREQARQMELAALKKQEEKEIARLRKQTVHKAQPIRQYKMCVPKTGKRPLTDRMSPLSSKRRRRA